ncbi:glycoside hydrolase family 36 protein [Chryseolinea lacunae]|uniref:Alpha-galactosidase n=1 Tax=Chryseolinea lacunae TaxID=2801331 RepID=A0ABS1L2L5_9BACT|nr:glycoside hydrolase family 36 protein [Chryseolinea lacunae]MBL0745752.1 alpha-galactosidase [Chryseolinea lacunae]
MKRTVWCLGFLALIFCVGQNGFSLSRWPNIISTIKSSKATVVSSNGQHNSSVSVKRKWSRNTCKTLVSNSSKSPIRIKEVILFEAINLFPPDTPISGEGFQMLSQTGGTLNAPVALGSFEDSKHYGMVEPKGYRVVYNLLYLNGREDRKYLLGFTSANRFVGKFYLSADTVRVVMDLENIELAAGETIDLEGFFMEDGKDRELLLSNFAEQVERAHPRRPSASPTGWCSWYCFGSQVTAQNVYDNLSAIKAEVPSLKYIQIDDGYQLNMGDWLSVGRSFSGGVTDVLGRIKEAGFEPAIWVAPFICDSTSSIFREHKDWLVKDENGHPLRSDKVGFGGWRRGPWYVLDGTNPHVQRHFETIFSTMREKWGCTYFKLDANYWGAIHDGKYYRANATRTEAYREGMKAIVKGAGPDAFILGCNHPLWPSLGLIHGSRSSMDVSRNWTNIKKTGKENLLRGWQNGRLWWNDPDCLLLTGDLPDNMFAFHASLLYATGGMLLSGDDVASIPKNRLIMLQKMAADGNTTTAKFVSEEFEIGWVNSKGSKKLVVLNWGDIPKSFKIPIDNPVVVRDFFSEKLVGHFDREIVLENFGGQLGCVYVVEEE